MKNLSLYLLIIFIVTHNTGVYELAKLPSFITHYIEHSQNGQTKGICDFISMHYFGHDLNDNDDSKDARLPFKNFHAPSHPVLLFIPTQQAVFYFFKLPESIDCTPYKPKFSPQSAIAVHLRPPCC